MKAEAVISSMHHYPDSEDIALADDLIESLEEEHNNTYTGLSNSHKVGIIGTSSPRGGTGTGQTGAGVTGATGPTGIIGTTSPTTKLQIKGSGTGIGTSPPAHHLRMKGEETNSTFLTPLKSTTISKPIPLGEKKEVIRKPRRMLRVAKEV